jgi:hypothetical protein
LGLKQYEERTEFERSGVRHPKCYFLTEKRKEIALPVKSIARILEAANPNSDLGSGLSPTQYAE